MRSLVLKILISLACVIVLVMMFFFGDEIIPENDSTNEFAQEEETYPDAFKFDPEELTYDGSGNLDLLKGVTLEGYNAQDLKTMVFTRIYGGENLSKKVIEYTADTKDGRVRSKRILNLENYSGPKITLPDDIPSVTPGTIDGLASLLNAKNGYAVDDGFGNDAREHVDISYRKEMTDSSLVHYTIALDNMFGDRDVVKVDVILSGTPSHLVLTDSQITVRVGETFDPTLYIAVAERADGTSAIGSVNIHGNIDTAKEGIYLLTFELDGQTATLEVNVIR